MEKGKMYHVNIYYSEEEVQDAFKHYYNDVKQVSKVYIFTKNAMALSLYGEENNVALYSSGGLWDKLKAWLAGEALFEQQFSQLSISKENQERYRSIIKNGGTIIVSTQDESINPILIDSNEISDAAFVEDAVSPLPPPNDVNLPQTIDNVLRTDSQNDDTEIATFNANVLNKEVDYTLFDAHSENEAPLDTKNQSFTQVTEELDSFEVDGIIEMDAQLDIGTRTDLDVQNKFNEEEENNTANIAAEHNRNEELIDHFKEPSLNDSIQSTAHEQHLFIADVSTANANQQLDEYYENEHIENEQPLVNNTETFVEPTKQESVSHVPGEASIYIDNVMNLLNNNGTNEEDVVNSIQQLQALAQQAQQFYGFNNKQPQINELLDLVLQVSPDEAMKMANVISSNVPTDSTESVLDFDLLAKLVGSDTDEVKNLFAVEQELENEKNIASDEQNDLSVDHTHATETFESEQLLNEVFTEPTSEHNRKDSP